MFFIYVIQQSYFCETLFIILILMILISINITEYYNEEFDSFQELLT